MDRAVEIAASSGNTVKIALRIQNRSALGLQSVSASGEVVKNRVSLRVCGGWCESQKRDGLGRRKFGEELDQPESETS
jgi:hypothetical protein